MKKKRFVTFLMTLVMCVSVLAGCSLVEQNDEKYYEATVCTITYADGEEETITKRELIMGYNSYGYLYVDYYGYTTEEAVLETLEIIIEQRLTIHAVKEYYEESGEELLNARETTYLWDELYDSIYSNLKEYFEDITGSSSSSSDSSDSSSSTVYTPYTKSAYLKEVDGQLVIYKTESASTIRGTYEARYKNGVAYDFEYVDDDGVQVFAELMYEKFLSLVENDGNWLNALNEYLADVKDNYTYIDFASNKECFLFELNRVYEILRDNYLVEKYEVIYNIQAQQDSDVSNVTVTDVLKYYSAKVRTDYANYYLSGNTSDYETNILDDVGSVYYILDGDDATNYFYVGYVKISFDDDQTTQLEEIQDGSYLSPTQQEIEIQKLYDSLYATILDEETGEETGETISAEALLRLIQQDVGQYQYDTTVSDDDDYVDGYMETARMKAAAFRKYLYYYSDDDTLKNADYNIVFGVSSDGEVVANDDFSDQDEVLEAIKELYNDGNAQIGDLTGLVKADDGYYIFFYAGDITNLFAVDENFEASSNADNIKVLASTYINIFSDKTLFDVIYEELTTDNFSVFQNMNMAYLRSQTQSIVVITNNIKDLY